MCEEHFPGSYHYFCFRTFFKWNWNAEYFGTSRLIGSPAFIRAEPEEVSSGGFPVRQRRENMG